MEIYGVPKKKIVYHINAIIRSTGYFFVHFRPYLYKTEHFSKIIQSVSKAYLVDFITLRNIGLYFDIYNTSFHLFFF
ncbi:MAG: hypothetical protein EA361_18435 [Bacteroidetes bacterium]|nr:MAG: hypothetical protein EA361_18435 [Bacteroidota bacterium]